MTLNGLEVMKSHFNELAMNAGNLAKNSTIHNSLLSAVELIKTAYLAGGCLFAAGNGGSASDAQHFIAELVSKLNKNRTPIRGFALSVDTSILTAIGNDYGYEHVFERQVLANMRPHDILLGITTSGNSLNIIKAFEACRELGCKTILLTGRGGGKTPKELCDVLIDAPGENTAAIQEMHLSIYHVLCYMIELEFIEKGLCHYV